MMILHTKHTAVLANTTEKPDFLKNWSLFSFSFFLFFFLLLIICMKSCAASSPYQIYSMFFFSIGIFLVTFSTPNRTNWYLSKLLKKNMPHFLCCYDVWHCGNSNSIHSTSVEQTNEIIQTNIRVCANARKKWIKFVFSFIREKSFLFKNTCQNQLTYSKYIENYS